MMLVTVSALAALAGCSAVEQATTDDPREVSLLTVSEPTLEIGVVDGAEEYLFGPIEAALRLPSGEAAVADASNSRILAYDAAGTFVRGWGWTGDSDVSYVRAYRLSASAQTRQAPAWLLSEPVAPPMDGVAPDEAEVRALTVSTIKNLASHQEIHYSTALSYTTDLGALGDFEIPEGLEIDFLIGNARGWAAVFAHPDFDRLCGLAYGYMILPGWSPGQVNCAPALQESTAGEGR
jgi:hypothetical protein